MRRLPPDPRHGRALPAADRLASVLLRLAKRQAADVAARLTPSGCPDLSGWFGPTVEAVTPLLFEHLLLGTKDGEQLARRTKDIAAPSPTLWRRLFQVAEVAARTFAVATLQTATAVVNRVLAVARQAGETLNRVKATVKAWFVDPARIKTAAEREAHDSYHKGQAVAAEKAGHRRKRWLVSAGACARCRSFAAQGIIPLSQPFEVGAGPYGVVQHPAAHPHCRCSLETTS